MIKFTASGQNIVLVGLGLEPENLERLKTGQPVRVRFSDLGFTGALANVQVMIFSGESTEAMEADLAKFINHTTVVRRETPA